MTFSLLLILIWLFIIPCWLEICPGQPKVWHLWYLWRCAANVRKRKRHKINLVVTQCHTFATEWERKQNIERALWHGEVLSPRFPRNNMPLWGFATRLPFVWQIVTLLWIYGFGTVGCPGHYSPSSQGRRIIIKEHCVSWYNIIKRFERQMPTNCRKAV